MTKQSIIVIVYLLGWLASTVFTLLWWRHKKIPSTISGASAVCMFWFILMPALLIDSIVRRLQK